MNQIQCLIRKEWVAGTPEENVRQSLLYHLVHELQFPLSQIAVEKGLKQMPHLSLASFELPDRRSDVVCFAQGIHAEHSLYPLLLIECKAVKITPKVISQATGYNHFLRAYYVALVNQDEVRLGWQTKDGYQFINRIPKYAELIQSIRT